ncbi:uncharacterized protein H6S33_006807 [Morchella sextelata]|uniref:uncharacterized protein n=1 Tax=Morchella sextelata TaxID=1174677 RepID=UPI001D055AAE|nr:uncharacterized protein H6S33_006807 [Morchella sextelata]KAH0604430.1 hypothetical protein H6S33_006807 [Morchella sextelata]
MVVFAVISPWRPKVNSVIGLKSLTAIRQDPPSPRPSNAVNIFSLGRPIGNNVLANFEYRGIPAGLIL